MRPPLHCSSTFSTCLWFTNFTKIPGAPTLNPELWTYSKQFYYEAGLPKLHQKHNCEETEANYLDWQGMGTGSSEEEPSGNEIPQKFDFFSHHPWRAPGTAPVHSGCGIAGGNPNGCPSDAPPGQGGNCPGGGYGYGPRAEDFPFRNIVTTTWTAGESVEVGWGITANHGGGYSYRLCKLGPEGRSGLTEECFQATPLQFADDHHWIQFGEEKANRTRIPALRTRQGTFPAGSHWSRNPIPACAGAYGGFLDKDNDCKEGTQFPPAEPHLKGFGVHLSGSFHPFQFSIVDRLLLPPTLQPGHYALSFRWDCEQTRQVWTACSTIQIQPKP